jgi:hypothetical protein
MATYLIFSYFFCANVAGEGMKRAENAEYDEQGELVTWIREMVDMSKLGDVAKRLKDL